jgi:predicted RNase H-like HicB family nuclease
MCLSGSRKRTERHMKIKAIVHEVEEGGFWAEVPSIAGCAAEGETVEEAVQKLQEKIEICLTVELVPSNRDESERVVEVTL